jgi:hypothetical protein
MKPLLFILSYLLSSTAYSIELSPAQIYYRCHSQFTRKRPDNKDLTILHIKKNQLNAIDACMRLIDSVKIENTKFDGINSKSYDVLKTFQSLHMSWFPNKDLIRQETETSTTDFFDTNEMGYHFTYNLFKNDSKFSYILTNPNSFRGIRYSERPATYIQDPEGVGTYMKKDSKQWALGYTKELNRFWKPKLVEFGQLIGIRPMEEIENRVSFVDESGEKINFDVSRGLGGGLLGSIPYIMASSTLDQHRKSDGGAALHRSWGKAIFSDVLCRDFPVLREEDVKTQVDKKSYLPFRKEVSCMQCHSTMDPVSGVIRNLVDVRLAGLRDDVFSPRALMAYPTNRPQIPTMNKPDSYFINRPLNGILYYRTHNGELVNEEVDSLSQLGNKLSQKDDIYICMAKRYFEFMTGIDVRIGDFSTEAMSISDTDEKNYRDFVVKQGLELKKHQSLKLLIEKILKSNYYSSSDYSGH